MIREMMIKDVPVVCSLCAVLGYPVSVELVEEQLIKLLVRDDHFMRVYEDINGKVLGFIEAQEYESLYSQKGFNILGLAVLPEAQEKGIGKQLIVALEQYANQKNYSFIRLNSGEHRKEAHLFYEAMGYDGQKMQKRFIKQL